MTAKLFRDVKTHLGLPLPIVFGRERNAQEVPQSVIFVDYARGGNNEIGQSATTRIASTKAFVDDVPFVGEIRVRSGRAGATANDHEDLAMKVMAKFMTTLRAVAHALYKTIIKKSSWSWPKDVVAGSSADGAVILLSFTLPGTIVEDISKLSADDLGPESTVVVVDKDDNELEIASGGP